MMVDEMVDHEKREKKMVMVDWLKKVDFDFHLHNLIYLLDLFHNQIMIYQVEILIVDLKIEEINKMKNTINYLKDMMTKIKMKNIDFV